MPTRRIFEMALLVVIFTKPAFGLAKLWATKTLAETNESGVAHTVAETVAVIL